MKTKTITKHPLTKIFFFLQKITKIMYDLEEKGSAIKAVTIHYDDDGNNTELVEVMFNELNYKEVNDESIK